MFGSTKKLFDKTKNGENVPSLGVAEVVSISAKVWGDIYIYVQ